MERKVIGNCVVCSKEVYSVTYELDNLENAVWSDGNDTFRFGDDMYCGTCFSKVVSDSIIEA